MGRIRNSAAALISVYAKEVDNNAIAYKKLGEYGAADRQERIAVELRLARRLLLAYEGERDPEVVEEPKHEPVHYEGLADWELGLWNDYENLTVGTPVRVIRSPWTAAPGGSTGKIVEAEDDAFGIAIDTDTKQPGFGWFFTKSPTSEYAFEVIR